MFRFRGRMRSDEEIAEMEKKLWMLVGAAEAKSAITGVAVSEKTNRNLGKARRILEVIKIGNEELKEEASWKANRGEK